MPRRPPPDYEQIEAELWKKSVEAIDGEVARKDDRLMRRVRTFVNRFGYGSKRVIAKIDRDKMFAANFVKEPRRTNFAENAALEWLQGDRRVQNIVKLRASGEDALYITSDGSIGPYLKKPKPSKSIDFRWTTGDYTVYAAHKYTKEGGGNQDSQFNEIRTQLANFQKGAEDRHTVFLAIVDGPYYTPNRLNQLRQVTRPQPPYSNAMPIQEIPDYLDVALQGRVQS